MTLSRSISIWAYTFAAALVVIVLNLQAPGSFQGTAIQLFATPSGLIPIVPASLAAYVLDILFVGVAWTVAQYNMRAVHRHGEERGRHQEALRHKD